jgi:hypothetical protein
MKKIRVIIYGVGMMGRAAARILYQKGVEIAAAIGNRSNIGKDIGEIAGLGRSLGVPIRKDADTVLKETEADIVIMTVGSTMDEMELHFARCLKNGFNVITIAEEAFYPYTVNDKVTRRLDALAKKHNVTISAGGIQDVFWFNMLKTISGACNRMDSVLGVATNNVDEYGPIAAKGLGIGCSVEEFEQLVSENGGEPDFFGISLEAVVKYFRLSIATKKSWVEPVLASEKVHSKCLDLYIDPGNVTGTVQITEIMTNDNTIFRTEFYTKVFHGNEKESSGWYIQGDPNVSVETNDLPGTVATCAAMINRIPDVINSVAGFITVDKMDGISYKPLSLESYLHT